MKGRSLAAPLVATVLLVAGCGSGHHDSGGEELRSGMKKSRTALVVMDRGIAAFRAGDRNSGMSDMAKGMSMMTESMGEMRAGIGMMSMEMTSGCGASHDGMRRLEDAVGAMRAGHAMMVDHDLANDADGLGRMERARKTSADAMDEMDQAMSCMGHGSTGMM